MKVTETEVISRIDRARVGRQGRIECQSARLSMLMMAGVCCARESVSEERQGKHGLCCIKHLSYLPVSKPQ